VSNERLTHGRLASASRWRLLFLAVQGTAGLALFSALGHILPHRAFAATAIAQGVIVIAQSIGDFGLSQAAVTVLPARIAAAPADGDELIAGAARAYLGATCVGLLLTGAIAAFVPSAAAGPVAVSALGAAAAIVVAGADGLLRSRGEFRRPLALMASSELAGFAGLPVAITTHSALATCAAVGGGMALGSLPAAITLVRFIALRPQAPLGPFVRAGVPLGLSQVFISLATRADTLLAGLVSGLVAGATFEGCWRIYQLSQYVAGGVASAAAPFIADALGGGRPYDALRILRAMSLRLLMLGIAGGGILYLGRTPIADLLAGTLGTQVARALPALAIVSPLQALSLAAYYTLIGRDGQRRLVLAAIIAGAVVNLALAAPLGRELGGRGIVIGCACGQAATALLLLAAALPFVRRTRRDASQHAASADVPPGLARPLR
jgi:O-antigen/teichoic acid export membrane protein